MNWIEASSYLEFLTFGKVRTAFQHSAKTSPSLAISASDIKFIRSLQLKKFRKKHGLFIVEGVKPVQELFDSEIEVTSVFATENLDFLPENFTLISPKELNRISGLKTPNKVLAIAKITDTSAPDWSAENILFLDGIKDPGNLGTMIRTAKWFGISQVVCSLDCVDAYDRKVVQSTMGALFHVNINYMDSSDAMQQAKEHQFTVIGTSMNGSSVYDIEPQEKMMFIIGSESHGMGEKVAEHCDVLCSIPNFESSRKIESLNASVATGIVLSILIGKKQL